MGLFNRGTRVNKVFERNEIFKKIILQFFLLLSLVLFLAGCQAQKEQISTGPVIQEDKEGTKGQPTEQKDQFADWGIYQNNIVGFEVKCPPDWYCGHMFGEEKDGATTSPFKPQGPMAEWLTIYIKADHKWDLQFFENQLKEPGVEKKQTKVGQYQAEKIIYSIMGGQRQDFRFQAEGKTFLVQAFAPGVNDDTPYLPFVDKILVTFKLL